MSAQQSLTGGDGISRERGTEFPIDLFLLHPENQQFLWGEAKYTVPNPIESEALNWFLGLGFLTLIFIPGFLNSKNTEVLKMGLLVLGLCLIAGALWLYLHQYRIRVANTGKLLLGQVIGAVGRWEIQQGRYNVYIVTIEYRLRLPDGRIINNWDRAKYMDMVGKPLPERGTPVAVLYLSESEKMLL